MQTLSEFWCQFVRGLLGSYSFSVLETYIIDLFRLCVLNFLFVSLRDLIDEAVFDCEDFKLILQTRAPEAQLSGTSCNMSKYTISFADIPKLLGFHKYSFRPLTIQSVIYWPCFVNASLLWAFLASSAQQL